MRIELTEKFCQSAKPRTGKPQSDYFDSIATGLALRVTANSKSWSLTTGDTAKRVRRTLGHFPEVGLARARTLALESRTNGDAAMTIADLVPGFLKSKVRRSADEVTRRFEVNVIPVIGAVRLSAFHRRDAARVIDAVKDRGSPGEARHVAEDIRAMARWATNAGYFDVDPLASMKLPPKSKPRERALSEDEIRTLWSNLSDLRPDYAAVVRLCLVTGQRRGEVAGMRRSELDPKAGTWTIPAERAKNGREHIVPLSEMALSMIPQSDSEAVFPTIDPECLTNEIRRKQLGVSVPWTLHDLRRTVATQMAILGVSPIVIGHVLNHVTATRGSVTLAHYVRHTYEAEKRAAADLWADRLAAIVAGDVAKVVPFQRSNG
jgi:integrase